MLKRYAKGIALLTSCFHLCSCASIVSGGSKTLPIMSKPDEATCEIVDVKSGKTILKAKTPHTATLEPSSGFFSGATYKVKLTKEGYLPHEQTVDSNLNAWYFGNIIFGGLIGILIVDPLTGAMWKIYDDTIDVKLYADSTEGRIAMATEKFNGEEAFKLGEYDRTISDTTKAVEFYPQYVEGYCMRSAAYAEKGSMDKAMADAEKAIEVKPDHPRGYKQRADLYVKKEELEKAMTDLNRAIALKPDYADALVARGKIYVKQNNQEAAKADLQSACKLGNNSACNFQF